jgi:hypothetical protein
MTTNRFSSAPLWLLCALLTQPSLTRAHSPAEEMAEGAQNFLAALTPDQRARATFEWKDDERLNWHFIPRTRKGIPFKELTPAQRPLAHALLGTGLSQRGFAKAATIMSLEQILLELEQGSGPTRDPELYFVSVFGKPGPKGAWGWRVEGHHLSVNFTIVNGEIAAAPSFFGSNPGEVKQGPRAGLRVLGEEEDLGRQLVKSLEASQKKAAIIDATAPKDILTEAKRKVSPLEATGLAYAKLTGEQQQLLRQLVREYADRHRPEVAEQDLAKIKKAGWDKVLFAWAGGLERGQGHYYRVQGPTFLLEYDNTQNNANHIHSVWRDFENDFGEDLLRRHYQEAPHGK